MPKNLYLVFSKPPESVSEVDYHRWYDLHARENIVSLGFLSAQRFAVRAVPDGSAPFTHLALYEYEGEMSGWRTDLTRRIEAGEIVLPEFFADIHFGSFDCTPLGGRVEPVREGRAS
jgi:hypothetical protein